MNADKDGRAGVAAGDDGYEEVQGVLVARDADGAWRYRPRAPGLARGGDGRAQFSLIAAGPVTMLALTASSRSARAGACRRRRWTRCAPIWPSARNCRRRS